MIEVVKEVTKELKQVNTESYYNTNFSKSISYPYITFKLNSEGFENTESFYLDIDVFDNNERSYIKLFELESNIKAQLRKKNTLKEEMFIRYKYIRSNDIPTDDDLIKRRSLQFQCKVYWRDR